MIEIWTDGSMRPLKLSNNKQDKVGHAGIGIVIKKNGQIIKEVSSYVGILDSNQAEYEAFIESIQIALDMEESFVKFYSDSNLLVQQMTDKYGAYSEIIIPYYMKAKRLLQLLPSYSIKLIPRNENKLADALTKKARREYEQTLNG